MDGTSGGLLGSTTTVIVLGIIYKIYKAINHKSININLCGKKWSASIDIDDKTEETNINIPKDKEEDYDENKHMYATKIQNAYKRYKSRRKLNIIN